MKILVTRTAGFIGSRLAIKLLERGDEKVLTQDITTIKHKEEDYISLTDMAKVKNADEPKDVVKNWLRNKNTIEFLELWKKINNEDFNSIEFDGIKNKSGINSL